MDSATTLAIARQDGHDCHTLAIDYGQRHRAELLAAQRVSSALGASSHKLIKLDLRAIGGSALTADIAVPESAAPGIPITYVPARNTIMLALALGYAETLDARELYCGVNAVDYSGYPDCRPAFIEAFQALAQVATKVGAEGGRFHVNAPLLYLSKAQIIQRGLELGVDFSSTVSCYQADAEGLACGRCDACRLRAEGFAQAGVADNTRYR
jgi:7-cyano-7-deazaguanine synthase